MIEQQLVALERQRQQSTDELDRIKDEQDQQKLELARLQPELTKLTKKRQTYQAEEPPLQRAWSESQSQLTRLQDNVRTLEQQQAINSQAQKRHQLSQEKLAARQQSWQTLWDQAQTQSPTHDDSLSIDEQDKSAISVIDELEAQLQQRARQQDSVAERLADLQPQAHTLQQRLTEQLREVTAQEKSHALLAGEYDTLHKIVHAKTTQSRPHKRSRIKVWQMTLLLILTIYCRFLLCAGKSKLSPLGKEHAQTLDKVLALWLDSQVLIGEQVGLISEPELSRYLPNLLSFQHSQYSQSQANKQSASRHSLWLPAQMADSADQDFTAKLLLICKLKYSLYLH